MDWRARFGIDKYYLIGLGIGLGAAGVCIWIVRVIAGLVGGAA